MIPNHIKKQLPKAKLLEIRITRQSYFARFRGANFTRWQIGRICVQHRSPWLKRSAQTLYPHLLLKETNQ